MLISPRLKNDVVAKAIEIVTPFDNIADLEKYLNKLNQTDRLNYLTDIHNTAEEIYTKRT
jgi:hypothetical protein